MKYAQEFRERFSKRTTFTTRDALLFLSQRGASQEYAHLLLHNLVRQGEAHRITKGVYSFKEEMQVVGFAYSPYYYGLQDALSIHNLWEQETNPVVITPRKIRPGIKQFLGNNYVVKRIDKKMFFGFATVKYHDFWINVSTPEKTLLDFIYFRQPLDEKTLAEIRKKISKKTLAEYLKKMPKRVKKKAKKLAAARAENKEF